MCKFSFHALIYKALRAPSPPCTEIWIFVLLDKGTAQIPVSMGLSWNNEPRLLFPSPVKSTAQSRASRILLFPMLFHNLLMKFQFSSASWLKGTVDFLLFFGYSHTQ